MKKIIRKVILILILIITVYFCYDFYKENKIRVVVEEENIIKLEKVDTKIEIDNIKIADVPNNFLGYEVTAKLIIPKIELETNVLKEYTEDALDVCVTKFWGPSPNEVGNFCIAGHNYQKENMFSNLIELEIGDELHLIDNTNGKIVYEIYDIYKVKPENISPLSQETDGKRVVTLITCVNYSDKRLIVKAIEKE